MGRDKHNNFGNNRWLKESKIIRDFQKQLSKTNK